jgi:cyclopropane-fatty-acyl-phospholipid synthase
MLDTFIDWMERGWLPDSVIRWGVRRLCSLRLKELRAGNISAPAEVTRFAEELKRSPVAIETKAANFQHYEIPAGFFNLVLGPHRKYSCAYWPENCQSLAEAENKALEISVQRAEIEDGHKILELGCGWGSLTLFMGTRFPRSKITAISNSNSQREFILQTAKERGLSNIEVLTYDLGKTQDLGEGRNDFDRVVSVEMFEHLRNYEKFFSIIQKWLKPGAKMFVHVFTHREFAYPFEAEGEDNWMGRYFFTGGQMPSRDLFTHFQKDFTVKTIWDWTGDHYQKTSEAWLKNMDAHPDKIRKILLPVYGEKEVDRWIQRWRVFFISVAECFGYQQGHEWGVNHYLFEKR